jgi:hypothetical protein
MLRTSVHCHPILVSQNLHKCTATKLRVLDAWHVCTRQVHDAAGQAHDKAGEYTEKAQDTTDDLTQRGQVCDPVSLCPVSNPSLSFCATFSCPPVPVCMEGVFQGCRLLGHIRTAQCTVA